MRKTKRQSLFGRAACSSFGPRPAFASEEPDLPKSAAPICPPPPAVALCLAWPPLPKPWPALGIRKAPLNAAELSLGKGTQDEAPEASQARTSFAKLCQKTQVWRYKMPECSPSAARLRHQ